MEPLEEKGAAIKGKRIAIEYRESAPVVIARGSSRHREQKATLYHAFCRIETSYIKN